MRNDEAGRTRTQLRRMAGQEERMGFGMLCARRAAILAALAGGFVIAVLGAGLFAQGVTWGGGAVAEQIRAGLKAIGL